MNEKFGCRWDLFPLLLIAAAAVIFATNYFEPEAPWWIYAIVMGPTFFGIVYMMAKVELSPDQITIQPLLPLKKPEKISHEDVEYYAPAKLKNGKGDAFLGVLKRTSKAKGTTLWAYGIKNFQSLSKTLEGIYPPYPGEDKN